jgi:hypothetical protein
VWSAAATPPGTIGGVEKVLGIGGYFLRAADPAALSAWYRDRLGLDAEDLSTGLTRTVVGTRTCADSRVRDRESRRRT